MVENRALELPERERRLDPERLHERAPRIAIRRECVRLPSRAVEGEHQLGTEALPERVLADQQLELAEELGTRAKSEISLDPLLEGFEPKLLEPSDLGLRPGLVGELGQRPASPSESASRNIAFASAGAAARAVPTSCSNRRKSNDPASVASSYAEGAVRITTRPSDRRS